MIVPADAASIQRAARLIEAGEIVAFPTETVYGLGARADSPEAVRKIYAAKGRPPENPSIVHVASADAAWALAAVVSDEARALGRAFWPGPLTLVMDLRHGAVAPEVTARGPTVAVRVPSHPVARALLEACGVPVAAPSANRSSAISPTTAAHVGKSLGEGVFVLDAGPTGFGIESTIVDVTRSPAVILRRGSISRAEIERAVGPAADRADAIVPEGERARAPGGLARHYAPRVPLRVAPRAEIERAALAEAGVLARGTPPTAKARSIEVLGASPECFARDLYAALHRLEDAGVASILVEEVPEDAAWDAIRDRLRRASR